MYMLYKLLFFALDFYLSDTKVEFIGVVGLTSSFQLVFRPKDRLSISSPAKGYKGVLNSVLSKSACLFCEVWCTLMSVQA